MTTRSAQFESLRLGGTTAAVPGYPVRTTTTSPVRRVDFEIRRWNRSVIWSIPSGVIEKGLMFCDRRKGTPCSTYSLAIFPT